MSVLEQTAPSKSGLAIDVSAADWVFSGTNPPRTVLVGVAGNIVGRQQADTIDVTYPVSAGYNPLTFVIIRKTGTTATGIVALF